MVYLQLWSWSQHINICNLIDITLPASITQSPLAMQSRVIPAKYVTTWSVFRHVVKFTVCHGDLTYSRTIMVNSRFFTIFHATNPKRNYVYFKIGHHVCVTNFMIVTNFMVCRKFHGDIPTPLHVANFMVCRDCHKFHGVSQISWWYTPPYMSQISWCRVANFMDLDLESWKSWLDWMGWNSWRILFCIHMTQFSCEGNVMNFLISMKFMVLHADPGEIHVKWSNRQGSLQSNTRLGHGQIVPWQDPVDTGEWHRRPRIYHLCE